MEMNVDGSSLIDFFENHEHRLIHKWMHYFEIYDRHGFAALGHPVDIEKIRQAAIEAAHLEGFNRSARDVTLRRLISFALSSTLKNAFEQVFSPPFIVESLFAELGAAPAQDVLVRVHYDGDHHYDASGVVVAHHEPQAEGEAAEWLRKTLQPGDSLERAAGLCLAVWHALTGKKGMAGITVPEKLETRVPGKVVEAAILDRRLPGPVMFRKLDLA